MLYGIAAVSGLLRVYASQSCITNKVMSLHQNLQACDISTDIPVGPYALPHFMADFSDCFTSCV